MGAELRDVPPASTQGAQREAGVDAGTHGSTLKEDVPPHTLNCSTALRLDPDPGGLARCHRGKLAVCLQPWQAEVSLQNQPPFTESSSTRLLSKPLTFTCCCTPRCPPG